MATTINPFSISPNPASLFLTPALRAAAHKVRYTIDNRQGLACVLGDPGMGKSSLMRLLYLDYEGQPDNVTVSYLTDPDFHTPNAFVRSICQGFDVPMKRSFQAQKDVFKEFILAQGDEGRNVILLLDEAQGMNPETMEVLRSFLNFESNTAKLLQIVMAGQLDLRDMLKLPKNRALKSRIVMYSLLSSLTFEESALMIDHRCTLGEISNPFNSEVLNLIYQNAAGVPRDILRMCGYAHEVATLSGDGMVSVEIAQSAIEHERDVLETADD